MLRKLYSRGFLQKFLNQNEGVFSTKIQELYLKPTANKSNDTSEYEEECKKCKQLIESVFGPNSYRESKLNNNEDPIDEPACENNHVVAFGNTNNSTLNNVENEQQTNPIIIKDMCNVHQIKNDTEHSNAQVQMSTSKKEEDEKLAQKVEIIDETPLVEAPKDDTDRINIPPRVLGNTHDEEPPICNWSPVEQAGTQDQAGMLEQEIDLDELAEKCMGLPNNEIDEKIITEMDKFGQQKTADPIHEQTNIEPSILEQSAIEDYKNQDISQIGPFDHEDIKRELDKEEFPNINNGIEDSSSALDYMPGKCGCETLNYSESRITEGPKFFETQKEVSVKNSNPYSFKNLTENDDTVTETYPRFFENQHEISLRNTNPYYLNNLTQAYLSQIGDNVNNKEIVNGDIITPHSIDDLKFNYHYDSAWGAYQYDCTNRFNQTYPSSLVEKSLEFERYHEDNHDQNISQMDFEVTNTFTSPTAEGDEIMNVHDTSDFDDDDLQIENNIMNIHSEVSNVASVNLFMSIGEYIKRAMNQSKQNKSKTSLHSSENSPISADLESEPVLGAETSRMPIPKDLNKAKNRDDSLKKITPSFGALKVPALTATNIEIRGSTEKATDPDNIKLSEMLKQVRQFNKMVYRTKPILCQRKPCCPPPCPPPPPRCSPPPCPPAPPACPPPPPPCPPPAPKCPPPKPCPPPPPPCCPPPPPPPCPPPPPPCPPPPPPCPPPPVCPPPAKKCFSSTTSLPNDLTVTPKSISSLNKWPEFLYNTKRKGVIDSDAFRLDNFSNSECSLALPFMFVKENSIAMLDQMISTKDYEPWSPIPSWRIPPKQKKKPPCPKEKCKLFPPAERCKEKPCSGFPRRFTDTFSFL